MKAVFLNEIGGELLVQETPTPKPGANQVLIKVQAAGINFYETQVRLGLYPHLPELPLILGAEVAGIVIEIGEGVAIDLIGKRVVAVLWGANGGSGGYAQYAVATVEETIILPDNVSLEDALAIPIQGLTAYFLLTESAPAGRQESIFIHGAAGGIGSIAVQLAKIMGVEKVIAGASTNEKLEIAKSLGADIMINYKDEDWDEQIRKATDGYGVDIIYSSGTDEVAKRSLNVLAPRGRFVIYGALDISSSAIGPEYVQQLVYNNQSITGMFYNYYISVPGKFKKSVTYLLHLLSIGALKILTDNSFELADAQKAHEQILDRQTIGKIVLKVNH